MKRITTVFDTREDRRILIISAGLAVLAIVLAPLHTAFTLLAIPFSGGVAYVVSDILSHAFVGRPFIFPSKWGWNTEEEKRSMAWSDHALGLFCGVLMVVCLFVFGEITDCIRGENVWHGEEIGLQWCVAH
jgi:membrane associated rhomboid family serine protease